MLRGRITCDKEGLGPVPWFSHEPNPSVIETRTAPASKGQTTATNTVRLHRVLKAPPERIYKAVLDPAANWKWLAPFGFTCTVHHLEAKVGSTCKLSFTNFSSGNNHSFGGKYLEPIPGERIVATDVFDDPDLPGEMGTTWTFKKVPVGTGYTLCRRVIPK